MKKLESTFLNMVLSLVLIAVVAAAGLAGIYSLTKEKIDDQQNQKRQAAIREVVLPNAEATVEIQITSDTILAEEGNDKKWVIHNIHQDGQFIGAAVETSGTGFGGEQGLGDKISNWFKTEKGNQDIRGRKGGELLVKQDGGDVDAITAATISSRAFLKAIREAYFAFKEDEVQAVTGASQLKNQPAEPAVDATTEATTGATQINETEVSHE